MERPSTAPPTIQRPDNRVVMDVLNVSNLQGLDASIWPANSEELFQNNTDWQILSQTLTTLHSQAEKCEKDLETLLFLKYEALKDPEGFLEKYDGNFPSPQNIVKIPYVNPLCWAAGMRTRRSVSSGPLNKHSNNQEILVKKLEQIQSKHSFLHFFSTENISESISSNNSNNTQNDTELNLKRPLKKSISSSSLDKLAKKRTTSLGAINSNSSSKQSSPSPSPSPSLNTKTTGNISATHNVAWSEEEKGKLNLLLVEYPEESIPSRRWAKISAAMGTRTASQVASRIAKQKSKREKIINSQITPTNEDEKLLDITKPEYAEYKRLEEALERFSKGEPVSVHTGFRCDGCKTEPIIGLRWSCSCGKWDLCEKCKKTKGLPNTHKGHTLKLY